MNMLKATKLYTLNGSVVWYENFISIKLFPKGRGANSTNGVLSATITQGAQPGRQAPTVACDVAINTASITATNSRNVCYFYYAHFTDEATEAWEIK